MLKTSGILSYYCRRSRAAIIALIQTLQEVLSTQTGVEHKLEASVSDGEGYDVRIILIEDEETWKTLKYPYSDPDCDYREGKIIHSEENNPLK